MIKIEGRDSAECQNWERSLLGFYALFKSYVDVSVG